MARAITLIAAILLCTSVLSSGQASDSKAEALVVCPGLLQSEPLTPYGFAKANLISLWCARNAAERAANEIKQSAKETDSYLSWLAAMMRITKTSTIDFICAKRSVEPFATKQSDENIRVAAGLLVAVYDAHIDINHRALDVLKKMDRTKAVELMDQITTLQVERGQRWSDIALPTTMALMSLIDLNRTDENGKANRLVVTKAQKQMLLDWADEHFPEFKNGTPKDQWSEPAKVAELYFTFFHRRKCSDE